MKKKTKKDIIILFLIIVIIILTAINILKINSNEKAKQIIKDSLTAQSIVSNYIGKMKSDTFDIYTTEQLLIGSTDTQNVTGTKIKNNENDDLLQIVSVEYKISQGKSKFYKLNTDNFEKEFNVKLYNKDGITWYIQDTGDIKISYTSRPTWWTNELDVLYLGA
jgi:uncharacterized protein YpmB